MTAADVRVPAAERIERDDDEHPDAIDSRQPEVPSRRSGEWEMRKIRRLGHVGDRAVAPPAGDQRQQMDKIEMQHIEEQGTRPMVCAGRRSVGTPLSNARNSSSAGPRVIIRNNSDGGYLTVLMNDITVNSGVLRTTQCSGSP
jgi:hypothetical protein